LSSKFYSQNTDGAVNRMVAPLGSLGIWRVQRGTAFTVLERSLVSALASVFYVSLFTSCAYLFSSSFQQTPLTAPLFLGAGGGSEQWEHHISEWFVDAWYGMDFSMAPPQHREDFLSRFRKQKGKKAELRVPISAIYARPDNGAPCRVTLGTEVIEANWRKALSRPLETAKREIARLVSMEKSGCVTTPVVVVSGGSARNPAVKSQMMALCKESGIPAVFTDDFDVSIAYE